METHPYNSGNSLVLSLSKGDSNKTEIGVLLFEIVLLPGTDSG